MPRTRTSWTKGHSGNPNGAPHKGQSLAEKFRAALSERLTGDYAVLDALIDTTVDKALKGDQQALEYALARGFGKMIDRVEATNVNQNYDFSNLSLEERLKLLEQLRNARATVVPNDNPDSD